MGQNAATKLETETLYFPETDTVEKKTGYLKRFKEDQGIFFNRFGNIN
jgi:hypothetical protein